GPGPLGARRLRGLAPPRRAPEDGLSLGKLASGEDGELHLTGFFPTAPGRPVGLANPFETRTARRPPMWKLVIEDDEGKRTLVPLTRDQYSVGRKEGNTIRLTERNVSREHARLFKKPPNGAPAPPDRPTIVLEDLTSYNGVFVNGLR